MAHGRAVKCAVVIQRTADRFGYSVRELTNRSSFPEIAKARAVVYLAARMSGDRNIDIARTLNRDKSTVGGAMRRALARAASDPEFAQVCAQIAKGA